MTDAEILRRAAWILEHRARKRTFALRVIIRVLERTADKAEQEVSSTHADLRRS